MECRLDGHFVGCFKQAMREDVWGIFQEKCILLPYSRRGSLPEWPYAVPRNVTPEVKEFLYSVLVTDRMYERGNYRIVITKAPF